MLNFLRVLFVLISVIISSLYYLKVSATAMIIAAVISLLLSMLIIILIEYVSHSLPIKKLFAAIIGLLSGLILGHFVSLAFGHLPIPVTEKGVMIGQALIYHILGFGIMFFFIINSENIPFLSKFAPKVVEDNAGTVAYKILDTSVIIDGRISDICDTGFIEGILIIPNFVLNELQMIADSPDSIKRNRGRRGLDILNKMQKDQKIMVKISDIDFPEIHEVDAKLVKLAKVMKAKIITNDFNLNKVAEFHGVPVLNINELSNALKPIVLPGEGMVVSLFKEGKDPKQAIGYLDDGTMVVVENGRPKLNEEVEVTVTSILQTTAGRMIFARLKE